MTLACLIGQALALSDTVLNKLGVVQENVDDTAGAAQVLMLVLVFVINFLILG